VGVKNKKGECKMPSGGAREGAGRKKVTIKKKSKQINIKKEVYDRLSQVEGRSFSEKIECLLERRGKNGNK